jgi:3-carboxy-cis,cis-muconate cycloisomerase
MGRGVGGRPAGGYWCAAFRVAMTNPLPPSSLLTPLISSADVRAILDDRARLQRMLDFEVALARAEAALGIIPALAIDPIAAAAHAERYDLQTLGAQSAAAGNVAIPLIHALTAEVAKQDATAARYVHWGATSQDIIDTALVLELRAVIDVLVADLGRAIDGFTALAGRHRRTVTVGRTWMQHGLPMPFGLKLAGYAAALARSRDRLRRLRRDALMLQFGGAVGTLAALDDKGLDVAERLAALLDLPLPEAPWHSHRDRLAEVASAFAILTGTCGKIARDVSLLMQTDVGEAFEPPAPGPAGVPTTHKRNPTAATKALAAATIAPNLMATILAAQVQEHERALGGWQAEWQTFPALALVTSGAVDAVADIAQGLEVDSERMRANLGETRGQIMAEPVALALGAKVGKQEAHRIIEEASRKAAAGKRDLQEVLAEDDRVKLSLSIGELAKLFEPMGYQGAAQTLIDRIVGSLQGRGVKR